MASEEEVKLLAKVLATAVPGLDQFTSRDERHATLLGKMAYNAYGVCFGGGRDDKACLPFFMYSIRPSFLPPFDSLPRQNDPEDADEDTNTLRDFNASWQWPLPSRSIRTFSVYYYSPIGRLTQYFTQGCTFMRSIRTPLLQQRHLRTTPYRQPRYEEGRRDHRVLCRCHSTP